MRANKKTMDLKIDLQRKRNFIFDFDGTIADSFEIHERAFQRSLEAFSLGFQYRDYAGLSTVKAFQQIFAANGRMIDEALLQELVQQKRNIANQLFRTRLKPIPGAVEFIRYLSGYPFRIFIASSGSRMNVNAGVDLLGIRQYIETVITAEDVANAKPDPELFLKVIDDHSLLKEESLVLEDALSGLLAAKNAGIDAICVDEAIKKGATGENEDLVCYNFFELKQQMEQYAQ